MQTIYLARNFLVSYDSIIFHKDLHQYATKTFELKLVY